MKFTNCGYPQYVNPYNLIEPRDEKRKIWEISKLYVRMPRKRLIDVLINDIWKARKLKSGEKQFGTSKFNYESKKLSERITALEINGDVC
ncbi:Hypothetical protein CINCED_3A021353 [Cinara cedri]|uniref:Uncharacterized protein n=1 Tax=Cinara cedri TaxID=506608 RepID=A0A5E4MX71_9HEMI|nr:Hypothetical protein CINCED_3A021353 [Cinara cedri]